MPRLDGLAVLDAMQADEATAAIPVVFVTGRATASELAEGLGRGAHDYVRKPVEEAELVARVRSALRTRRLRDELRERNLQLERMARTDVLTGMVDRRHGATVLAEACTAAAATGESLAVVMADIDHFKHVNDHHGHAAGDVVLRAVADVMRDGLVTGETAVRWGGEEFLLVLPGCEASRRPRPRRAPAPRAVAPRPSTPAVGATASPPASAARSWAAARRPRRSWPAPTRRSTPPRPPGATASPPPHSRSRDRRCASSLRTTTARRGWSTVPRDGPLGRQGRVR